MSELQKKLGLAFKAERERRKLKIDDLSDELKISATNLEAIESGVASDLPSDLYYKLFTKSYAERLGIDLTATIEAIKDEIGLSFDSDALSDSGADDSKAQNREKTEAEPTISSVPDTDTSITHAILPLAMGATVMAGLVLGLYTLFTATDPANQATDSGDALRAEVLQYKAEIDKYNWDLPPTEKPQPLVLTLSSVQDSWATVLADGDTVVYRTILPGRAYRVEADHRFLVSIGIPSVVTVKVNGRDLNLRDPESRRISRVEINQINVNRFPRAIPGKPKPTPTPATLSDTSTQAGDRF